MVDDARALLAELEVPFDKVHQELFYVDDIPPEILGPPPALAADAGEPA